MKPRPIRCAIYTRKSTEEGLDQEFTSLDAQREAAEAYVRSQAGQHWTCLRTRYDDGGFSGGNTDRPALQRLLQDIQASKVDCVVVYKVDRLSRSLLDFARMMALFEEHQVSFVSVTQQFNTATSMGRLVLNVLLSFAQFEREIISERTRDKIAAARRKGKWAGGMPLLGYDVDPRCFKLVINEPEACLVREIFQLYLQHQGLIPVVQELERRGWRSKRWLTRKGHERGGQPFNKTRLHRLLSNCVYVGKLKYKNEVHAGEHVGIVDPQIWQQVQDFLHRQGRTPERQTSTALLKGLLYCKPCGCAMTPTHAGKKAGKCHRYYICLQAVQCGRRACPSRSLSAPVIEQWVIGQLHRLAKEEPSASGSFAELATWDSLGAEQQASLIRRWVERVDYDGTSGKVSISLLPEVAAVGKSRTPRQRTMSCRCP
jgi:site-specific DNA recombinase